MTTIISKSGTGIPASDQLETAELAVDTSNGDLYTKLSDDTVVQINGGSGSGDGGTGSSVHIGDTPPASPEEGQQWMEVPVSGDATMWIYDGDKWLQQPGGKDGADGTDGVDGLWTDNGDTSISYTAGNVGIGASSPDLFGHKGLHLYSGGTTQVMRLQRGNGVDFSIRAAGSVAAFETATAHPIVFRTNGSNDRLTIDADGYSNFKVPYTASVRLIRSGATGDTQTSGIVFGNDFSTNGVGLIGSANDGFTFRTTSDTYSVNPLASANGDELVRINTDGRVDITGSLYVNGTPKIGTKELIETLSTLRASTLDETVDVRQALASACDKLIEKFEAMQEVATQEISDE